MIVTASTPAPRGAGLTSGVLADAPAANASLDQTVQKKKSKDRQNYKGTPFRGIRLKGE